MSREDGNTKLVNANFSRGSLAVLLLILALILCAGPTVAWAESSPWSASKRIAGPWAAISTQDPSIVVDSKGVRHMLYHWSSSGDGPSYLTYKNSKGVKKDIASGFLAGSSDIAVDSNDVLHVLYKRSNGSVRYKTTIMLFMTVPGINSNKGSGAKMIARAKLPQMARYKKGEGRVVHIRESANPTEQQVISMINKASIVAKRYRRDIIVNVDMDLEGQGGRTNDSGRCP